MVVSATSSGPAAVKLALAKRVDLVLLDVRMHYRVPPEGPRVRTSSRQPSKTSVPNGIMGRSILPVLITFTMTQTSCRTVYRPLVVRSSGKRAWPARRRRAAADRPVNRPVKCGLAVLPHKPQAAEVGNLPGATNSIIRACRTPPNGTTRQATSATTNAILHAGPQGERLGRGRSADHHWPQGEVPHPAGPRGQGKNGSRLHVRQFEFDRAQDLAIRTVRDARPYRSPFGKLAGLVDDSHFRRMAGGRRNRHDGVLHGQAAVQCHGWTKAVGDPTRSAKSLGGTPGAPSFTPGSWNGIRPVSTSRWTAN